MPIAAVPAYLGNNFADASPGMRFGMYLTLWGINRRSQERLWKTHDIGYEVRGQQQQEREVKYENKVSALSDAKKLGQRDKDLLKNLAARQSSLAQSVPADQMLRLDARANAPFTTGLGNEHPLENGFSFLNPYGLPYLPASGIKGVLRQAARELASGEWGDSQGWNAATIDALFGKEDSNDAQRGALAFWDVIPQIHGDSLQVEIMTPHQSHYYQQKRDRKAGDSTSPHDSGQPTPISFLTVPAGSGFAFHVVCDLPFLRRLAPELAADDRWKTLLTSAFEHAFQWLGFGAKTAVGYGAMESPAARAQREQQEAVRKEAEREVEKRRKQQQALANAVEWVGARVKFNKTNGTLTVEKNGKTANAIAPLGRELLESVPPEERKKIEANQFVKVNARVSGNELLSISKWIP
ncbi:MAG: hypothetical protein Fur0026_10320 [Sideroxydans sp.]